MGEVQDSERRVGLWGATGVGVGAIVGGGILVLAGVAFEAAGPGALFAFAINGGIAVLTALSFAEMSTAFPESGGAYTFAKKVLSVRAAFAVGWVLWFAYIVAGVLYALGFAEYGAAVVADLLRASGHEPPGWLVSRQSVLLLGFMATGCYTAQLVRSSAGGKDWATLGKLVVFAVLVGAGLWALLQAPPGMVREGTQPWLPHGWTGLLSAMGFTFIALQGFDLIAAIAGEVKTPRRVIPRAMLMSLGLALLVYLPLLFITSTVGRDPGVSIAEMASAQPETLMPNAVQNYLGRAGYWMVMIAAVLSTLSALGANLLAASRVALTMARDRTLPPFLARVAPATQAPQMAVYASTLTLLAISLMVPDLAAAGAAASLIFLLSFALVHWTAYLARRRGTDAEDSFRCRWFPLVPFVGGGACVALAVFQALAVPSAGQITLLWLGLGAMLYYSLFATRAEAVDAFSEAADPALARLRGRNPLVLVPVANPASASAIVRVAAALAPPRYGRVLLLSVLRREHTRSSAVDGARSFELGREVSNALAASFEAGQEPETLITVADDPWSEIVRVAAEHQCESLLLGLSRLEGDGESGSGPVGPLEQLLNRVARDVAILRAPEDFRPQDVRELVVPVSGRRHDALRARLLGALCREAKRQVVFLSVVSEGAGEAERERRRRELQHLAEEESPPDTARVEVLVGEDVVDQIADRASSADLLVVGLHRHRGRRLFGEFALRIAARTEAPTIMLSHEG